MFRLPSILSTLCLSILFTFSAITNAEQFKQFNNLEVHYMALPSTFIQPDIATQYKIKRSNNNGLINISVLDNQQKRQALPATITGKGTNLIGQSHELVFNEVKEGKAIYYIADIPFINEEIINFEIQIKTEKKYNTLKFQHKFYVE